MNGPERARLRTQRLDLDPVSPEDEDGLLAVFRDEKVRRYLLDDELVPAEWVRGEIESSMCNFAASGWGLWAVRRSASPEIIGFTGFREFFDPPELQLLYGLLPAWWGSGLATEASRAVIDHAFRRLEFEQVVAATDSPNRASVRVMERLGMTLDRRTDDGEDGTVFYILSRARHLNRETIE